MNIIFKPILTEKMNDQAEAFNRYGFIVDRRADKQQIKAAIEKMYDVAVESVNTMNFKGKRVSRYTHSGLLEGRTNHYKKAIVTLCSGQEIDFYKNI